MVLGEVEIVGALYYPSYREKGVGVREGIKAKCF